MRAVAECGTKPSERPEGPANAPVVDRFALVAGVRRQGGQRPRPIHGFLRERLQHEWCPQRIAHLCRRLESSPARLSCAADGCDSSLREHILQAAARAAVAHFGLIVGGSGNMLGNRFARRTARPARAITAARRDTTRPLPPAPAASPRRGMPPAPKFLPQLTRGSARRETTGGGHGRRLSQVNVIKGNGR